MSALHVPTHPVRLVTASSLFDGHDASINIMRRIFQSQGCEVIHLGHNRSVQEVVEQATAGLNEVFADPGIPDPDVIHLTATLARLRAAAGDPVD